MSREFKFLLTQYFKEEPSLSPWSLSKKLIKLILLYEKKGIFFSISSISERSIKSENTLYLKECSFGLNLL